MAKYKKLTPEQRKTRDDQRLAEAQERLNQGVAALIEQGSEGWVRYLTLQSKMHRYSFRNTLLILAQDPEATMVAGFERWKVLGRPVKKRPEDVPAGEWAIYVYAPFRGRRRPKDFETDLADADGWIRYTYYRLVPVFDVRQTEGPPLERGPKAIPLEGDGPELRERFDRLALVAKGLGYTVTREDCGKAEADVSASTKTIRVRPDRSDAHSLASVIHEIAHVVLNHVTDHAEYRQHRGRMEVEADSVAYLVASALGVDGSSYSFPYVATWSKGDPKVVMEVGDRVSKAARQILDTLNVEDLSGGDATDTAQAA
jgi:N-terminal domain of anti-restriction factor ArdC/IrrE N-terminal-like domain